MNVHTKSGPVSRVAVSTPNKDLLGRALLVAATATLPLMLAQVALAQETEECHCDAPQVALGGNMFSIFGGRPMLGISLDMGIDRDMEETGVLITDVLDDGPAAEAGILEGDVVTSLDGHDLTEPLDARQERWFDEDRSFPGQRLTRLTRDLEEGEPVEITVLRDGESMTFTVTPEQLEDFGFGGNFIPNVTRSLSDLREELRDRDWSFQFHGGDPDVVVAPRFRGSQEGPFVSWFGNIRGLQLVELNPGLGSYFGTEDGVLVTDVDEDTALGLMPGDVVLDVDGRAVDSPSHFWRVMSSYRDGEAVEFRVMRDGREIQVSGEVE